MVNSDGTTTNSSTPVAPRYYSSELYSVITQNYATIVTAPTIAFDSWCSDLALTLIYTFRIMPTEEIVLYAK